MKRLPKIATIASAIILGLLVIIWPVSYSLNLVRGIRTGKLAPSDSITLISGYRLGFENGAAWFYNYEMPWFGGTIGLSDGPNAPKPVVRHWCFGGYGWGYEKHYDKQNKLTEIDSGCDFPGIYCRRFWTQGHDPAYTTLRISLCYPLLLSAIFPLLWILRHDFTVLPVIKAPLAIQLFRCLFIACLFYFGSLLLEFRHSGTLAGWLIIASFPFCALLGLFFTFIRAPLSRWILSAIGILIPGVVLGAIDFWLLPNQGWFDTLGGLLFWCAIVGQPAIWALALFKDQKTKAYFTRINHARETPA